VKSFIVVMAMLSLVVSLMVGVPSSSAGSIRSMPVDDPFYQNSYCGPGKEGVYSWYSVSALNLPYDARYCHHIDSWSNDDFIPATCDGCSNQAYWRVPRSGLPVPVNVWAWQT
jgi:hypothetical protein